MGEEVTVLPSGEEACVSHLYQMDREVERIESGSAVTVQLDREIDVSRGDVIMKDASLRVGDVFSATILWMDDAMLTAGRNYIIKLGTKQMPATVLRIQYKIDIHDGYRFRRTGCGRMRLRFVILRFPTGWYLIISARQVTAPVISRWGRLF